MSYHFSFIFAEFEAKLEDIRAEQSKIAENANQEIGNAVRKITSLLQKTTAAARSKDTEASKIVTEGIVFCNLKIFINFQTLYQERIMVSANFSLSRLKRFTSIDQYILI